MNNTEFRKELKKIYNNSDVATDGTYIDTDLLKSKVNIVDIIQSRIDLKKRGSSYTAKCPFHGEKTGSFTVSEKRQTFKCFGCGATGDAIEFVMKYDKCTFKEAVCKLS